jgi:hypothetical protein
MTASTATEPQPTDLVDLFTRLPGGVHRAAMVADGRPLLTLRLDHVYGWVRQDS